MRYARTLLLAAALVLVTAGAAWAAGEAHPTDWKNLAWRILNFALVAGVLWLLAGKKIAAFFNGRKTGIETELADLEARKQKAASDLAAVEQRIANLEQERAAILAEYRTRGEAVKAEIIAKAEQAAAQITSQARQTAQSEMDQALAAMRTELAAAVVETARTALTASLTEKDHQKLIDASITKVVLQ